MLSPLIGRPEEGGSPGGPVGTAEEAAAGEVTDRMSSFISLWTFSSACPSRHAGVQPLWCCFFFGLFVFPAARQDLWTLWKLNKFQNFALPHFKNTKIGKSTAHTPSLRSPDRHEGACCVWTSSFKCHRPGELPVPSFFLFFFFLWMFLFLSGAQKCSPQMCFTEQFQMFLRPAQACTGVTWDTVGVVLLSSGGPLTTKARDQPWAWELTQSFCLFFFLLSHAFLSQRPLKASANYRTHTSPHFSLQPSSERFVFNGSSTKL